MRCNGLFDVVHVLKTGLIDSPWLCLEKRRKITQRSVGGMERLLQHGPVLGRELSNAQGILSRCIAFLTLPGVALLQLSPPVLNEANAPQLLCRHVE